MDKRQKQVFRLVTLLPAFPAAASGTRGEQVLRLTAAGPLPDLTGFPMKLVAALLPAQDGKRCLTCQHRVFVSILQHFEIIVKNHKSAPRQAIYQSPRQFWAGGIFESADHSGCVVFHNFPACRRPFPHGEGSLREAFPVQFPVPDVRPACGPRIRSGTILRSGAGTRGYPRRLVVARPPAWAGSRHRAA